MKDRRRPADTTTGMTTIGGQLVVTDRLAQFRRIYRWFNLTVLHQGIWPLLVVLAGAPDAKPGEVPMPWFLARAGAPAVAAMLALLYIRRLPVAVEPILSETQAPAGRPGLAAQVKFGVFALCGMLIVARLAQGPLEPSTKLVVFGLADVAAFHLIHFGVVRRSYPDAQQGAGLAVLLFGLSWGFRDLLLTSLGPDSASPVFALLAGTVIGVVVALAAGALRSWPGGFWVAAATHLLVIYLIIGFSG